MIDTKKMIKECTENSQSRIESWISFINTSGIKTMAEIGVYKGDFAVQILNSCDLIEKYYMIDPWRHLDNWNKPANVDNKQFEQFYDKARSRTDFATNKRVILRGKTTEVISQISDESLDFVYIDGDHTLRGITIDLINVYHKIRAGGWIGGDDFCQSIRQHSVFFEPTFVFPFAVYFAEAMSMQIYALPHNQFLIEKTKNSPFTFVDLTGNYSNLSLRDLVYPANRLKLKLKKLLSFEKNSKN